MEDLGGREEASGGIEEELLSGSNSDNIDSAVDLLIAYYALFSRPARLNRRSGGKRKRIAIFRNSFLSSLAFSLLTKCRENANE